jgi:hypothetical protein
VRLRRRDARGASAVEFALIAPWVLLIIFGGISFGFIFFHYISLTDSVRAGARFGGTTLSNGTWAEQVRARTVLYSAGALTTDQVCVQLVRGPSTNDPLSGTEVAGRSTPCALDSASKPGTPANLTATQCVVKVWAARPDTVLAPPLLFYDITLRRGSVTPYERTPCS